MSYTCDDHPGSAAVLLITNLGNGDVVGLCPVCIYPWASALAASFAGGLEPDAAAEVPDPVTGDPTHDDGLGDDQPVPYYPAEPGPAPTPDPEPSTSPDPGTVEQLGDTADLPMAAEHPAQDGATVDA